MSEPVPDDVARSPVPARYRVHLLPDPKPTERGVVYRRGSRRLLLPWGQVQRATAAEVGEPGGVRSAVFDLVVALDSAECVACRVEAAPGEPARLVARAIQLGIGRERCCPSLAAAAADGSPSRRHLDLATLEEATLEAIRFG